MDFLHGTTTLAFKYQGGVVVAVDSRATGNFKLIKNSLIWQRLAANKWKWVCTYALYIMTMIFELISVCVHDLEWKVVSYQTWHWEYEWIGTK